MKQQIESEMSEIMMVESISVLDKLEKQVNVLIKNTKSVNSRNDYKAISFYTLSAFITLINRLKEEEIENSRIDFKEGYLKACLDMGDFFGLSKEEAYPNDSEMEEIEKHSLEYIKLKFKRK